MIRKLYHLTAVLYDQHCIVIVTQSKQQLSDFLRISRMQAGCWLIKNIGDIAQAAAQMAHHFETLRFSARHRICAARQAQISQSHIHHVMQAHENLTGDRLAERMVNGFEYRNQIADLHVMIVPNGISIDFGSQCLWIESAAAACRTQIFFDKLHGFLAHALAQLGNVSVQIQPVKSRDNALIRQLGNLSCIVANEIHNQRFIRPNAKCFPLLLGKISEFFIRAVQRIEFIIKLLPAAAGKL